MIKGVISEGTLGTGGGRSARWAVRCKLQWQTSAHQWELSSAQWELPPLYIFVLGVDAVPFHVGLAP
jgi:hypothetical protein